MVNCAVIGLGRLGCRIVGMFLSLYDEYLPITGP